MSTYNLVDNFYDLQRYVKTCADRANLQVVWGKPDDTPSTDGKRVLIPRIDESYDETKLQCVKYSVAHEVAHCLYTDFDYNGREIEEISMRSRLGLLWNLLEDHRIDYLNSLCYAGDYALCKQSYSGVYNTITLDHIDDAEFHAAIIGNIQLCTVWQPDLIDCANRLADEASPEVREHLARFLDVCSDLIYQARDTEALSGTALTYKAALAFLGTDAEEVAQKKAKEEAEGDGGSASGKGKEDKEGATSGIVRAMVSAPDMAGDDKALIDSRMEESPYGDGDYMPDPLSTLIIDDYPAKRISEYGYAHGLGDIADFVNKHIKNAGGMANKLRTKLQILSRSRTKYGTKSGKLHANALHRICIPDGGEYSQRIFKRKEQALDLDVAVTVLVDMSGSMSGEKYQHAALATALLNESLGTVLRVPLELLGFTESMTTDHYKTHMVVLKNFQTPTPRNQLVQSLDACRRILSENTDGEAILFSHDRLRRQRAKRKVLFVLSDGSPCGGYHKGDNMGFTKKVITAIEQRSPVEIYGIGFMDTGVKRMYKEHAIIERVDEIESKLVSVITKKVFGV